MKNTNLIKSCLFLIILTITTFWFGCKSPSGSSAQEDSESSFENDLDTQKIKTYFLGYQYDSSINNQFTIEDGFDVILKSRISTDYCRPICKDLVETYDRLFEDYYKSDINQNINCFDFSIKWDAVKTAIDYQSIVNSKDTGVGFFYVIDTMNASMTLTYVIVKAMRDIDNDTIKPIFHSDTSKFLMLTNSTPEGYRKITLAQFKNYSSYYKEHLQVRRVNNVYNVKDIRHPQICFQRGDSLAKFYNHNVDLIPPQSNLFLVIKNGAAFPKAQIMNYAGTVFDLLVQIPIFIFKYNGSLLLDNSQNTKKTFQNKALDVGRLCPPDC